MNWNKIKYFKPAEFVCKCGCGQGADKMHEQFVVALDMARKDSGTPFMISSGYRCEKHNVFVGGVPESSHVTGLAVDIATFGSEHRAKVLTAVMRYFNRVGIHRSFIHVDLDPDKPANVVWLY